jgi:hypothetical protein
METKAVKDTLDNCEFDEITTFPLTSTSEPRDKELRDGRFVRDKLPPT